GHGRRHRDRPGGDDRRGGRGRAHHRPDAAIPGAPRGPPDKDDPSMTAERNAEISEMSDMGGVGAGDADGSMAELRARIERGGAPKYHEAAAAKGKLFARERIDLLLDEGA